VEAGATELVLLHHGRGEAELGSADGTHVPTMPPPRKTTSNLLAIVPAVYSGGREQPPMSPVVIVLAVAGLVVGVGVGYDAERWGRNINGWSLAGASSVSSRSERGSWCATRRPSAAGRRSGAAARDVALASAASPPGPAAIA